MTNRRTTPASRAPAWIDFYVGDQIRFRRMSLGLTQRDVAPTLGLTWQQLQKYETGVNRISVSRLKNIADTLGVSVGWFFQGLPDAPPAKPRHGDAIELVRIFYAMPERLRRPVLEIMKLLAEPPED